MTSMLDVWQTGGKDVFTMRQTHVVHVFGNSCTPAGKLVFRISEMKSIRQSHVEEEEKKKSNCS
jgi:hypothetical protein